MLDVLFINSPLYFLRQSTSLALKLTDSASLASQCTPGTCHLPSAGAAGMYHHT